MGRGSGHTAGASAALRVLPGGRDEHTARRQPPMDAELDRLWLSHRKELERVAERLGKAHRLGMPQLSALVKRLNALGAEVGLPPHWKLVAREHPGKGERVHAVFVHRPSSGPWAVSQGSVLEDVFDGSLVDGMAEARYLGRRLCELPGWLRENTEVLDAAPALAAR